MSLYLTSQVIVTPRCTKCNWCKQVVIEAKRRSADFDEEIEIKMPKEKTALAFAQRQHDEESSKCSGVGQIVLD